MPNKKKSEELTYEQKVENLDTILANLDNSETPIDKLAENVKTGTRLIRELNEKLNQIELEVRNAFKEIEKSDMEA